MPEVSEHRKSCSKWGDWCVGFLLSAIHAVVVSHVYKIVPEPYMDEIFHIRQTRKYCANDWSWDPMITTPPLLYLLAMPLCGKERYVNSVLIGLTFVGCCRLRRLFSSSNVILPSLAVLFLPVLLHSSLLFYTDLLSLCLVIWAFSMPVGSACALFSVSLFARQTNIIWAGLYAAVNLIRRFKFGNPFGNVFTLLSLVYYLRFFVLLAVAFVGFVIVNGGIVLGDPSAHQPLPHMAQLLYLSAFCSLHAWPSLVPHTISLARSMVRPMNLALLLVIFPVIHYFSFSHPYLLADNRHIPFYLWRKFLSKPTLRLSLAPLYVGSILAMNKLSSSIAPVFRLLFFICSIAVVVPAHLIEPRYFIVPYSLWRLSANTPNRFLSLLEVFSQLIIFSVLFYLFLYRPFEWAHEPGTKQRFMW